MAPARLVASGVGGGEHLDARARAEQCAKQTLETKGLGSTVLYLEAHLG